MGKCNGHNFHILCAQFPEICIVCNFASAGIQIIYRVLHCYRCVTLYVTGVLHCYRCDGVTIAWLDKYLDPAYAAILIFLPMTIIGITTVWLMFYVHHVRLAAPSQSYYHTLHAAPSQSYYHNLQSIGFSILLPSLRGLQKEAIVTLVLVSAVFFLSFVPHGMFFILSIIFKMINLEYSDSFVHYYRFTLFVINLNSVANPFIYFLSIASFNSWISGRTRTFKNLYLSKKNERISPLDRSLNRKSNATYRLTLVNLTKSTVADPY